MTTVTELNISKLLKAAIYRVFYYFKAPIKLAFGILINDRKIDNSDFWAQAKIFKDLN